MLRPTLIFGNLPSEVEVIALASDTDEQSLPATEPESGSPPTKKRKTTGGEAASADHLKKNFEDSLDEWHRENRRQEEELKGQQKKLQQMKQAFEVEGLRVIVTIIHTKSNRITPLSKVVWGSGWEFQGQ